MMIYPAEKITKYNVSIFLLFFLVTLANYFIYVGFAVKPFMVFLGLYAIFNFSSLYFPRLQLFEIALLLFYIMYSFSGVFSLYPASSVRIILGIMVYLACYFMMKSVIADAGRIMIEKAISDAGILFNTISLILYGIGLASLGFIFEGDRIYKFGLMLDRDYPRLIGVVTDPNYYIFYNTLFFTYYLCHLNTRKNKLGLLLSAIANVLTFSRGGLIVMAFILLLYILQNNLLKQVKLVLGFGSLLAVSMYIAAVYLNFDIYEILKSRFADFFEDGGSGRLELWGRAWGFFSSHMWVGIGASNFTDYNQHHFNDDTEVHNTFLTIITESGLLGITFFTLFIILVLVQIFQSGLHKSHPYLLFAFLGFIIQMAFLSVIINDMYLVYLAILAAYIRYETNSSSVILQDKKRNDLNGSGGVDKNEYSTHNG